MLGGDADRMMQKMDTNAGDTVSYCEWVQYMATVKKANLTVPPSVSPGRIICEGERMKIFSWALSFEGSNVCEGYVRHVC